MLITLLVWMLLALSSIYAALAGGTTGRIGAALSVGATMATLATQYSGRWSQTHWPVLLIDMFLLVALYGLALKSRAYWPIWATGFHLITVLGHAATFIAPGFSSSIYYYFNGMWAIFVQMAMVWGIALDRINLRKDI